MNTFPSPITQVYGAWALLNNRKGTLENATELTGRILLVPLFVFSSLGKLGAYSATAAYMTSAGVPSALLPVVVAMEILGPFAILIGLKTRVVAFLLAAYSVLTALIFHHDFADQEQIINFLKNVSIAGGFLLLVARGPGPFSLDRQFANRSPA